MVFLDKELLRLALEEFVANRWYHVAITRNSSNVMTMWLDAVSVGTVLVKHKTGHGFSIGANGNGSEPFNGYISNVRWIVGTAFCRQISQ